MVLKFAISVIVVLCIYGQKRIVEGINQTTCVLPKPIMNGHISYPIMTRPKNQLGSIAILFCHPSYVLEGNDVATCCKDGMWRPSFGNCKKLSIINETFCLPYVSKDIPSLHYEPIPKMIQLNATVVLKCPDGQQIVGSAKSQCIKGIWRPTLGRCIKSRSSFN